MTLQIYDERDNIAALTGSVHVDLTISSEEQWEISSFGAGASCGNTEAQMRYSNDNGQTWTNPFGVEGGNDRIAVIHLDYGSKEIVFVKTLPFSPGILRITLKNYNAVVAEIGFWINGIRNQL